MVSTCKVCGLEAPVKYVNFSQNIGMLFARSSSNVSGNLCRRCIKKYFKAFTLTTFFLGWWGLISCLITPFILVSNIYNYLRARSLPEPGIAAMNNPLVVQHDITTAGDRSFKFKLVYGMIVWPIALIFILQALPNTLEKYSPKLNAYLHSGTPTSEADMDYRVDRFSNSFTAYNKLVNGACPEKVSFKECRSKLLAARPALDDMGQQYTALTAAWVAEKQQRTVPDSCKIPMDNYFAAINGYWTTEDKVLRLFASVNPDSQDSIRQAIPTLDTLTAGEDTTLTRLREKAKLISEGEPCKGY
jgi:hypothetical protein